MLRTAILQHPLRRLLAKVDQLSCSLLVTFKTELHAEAQQGTPLVTAALVGPGRGNSWLGLSLTCSCSGSSSKAWSSSSSGSSGSRALGAGGPCWQQYIALRQLTAGSGTSHCRQMPASSQQLRHASMKAATRKLQYDERQLRALIRFEHSAITLGTVQQPYEGPKSELSGRILLNLLALPREIWKWMKNKLALSLALSRCMANIPGHDTAQLPQDIAQIYRQIGDAQATYNLEAVRNLVGQELFQKLKARAQTCRLGGWDHIQWSIENDEHLSKNIKLVHGRALKSEENSQFEWIQLTFRIRSKQRFAAYKLIKEGRVVKDQELVAGDPDQLIDVEDYWVFERKTKVPIDKQQIPLENSRWRLVLQHEF